MYFVAKNISGHKLLGLKVSNPYFFMITVFAKIALFTETVALIQELLQIRALYWLILYLR